MPQISLASVTQGQLGKDYRYRPNLPYRYSALALSVTLKKTLIDSIGGLHSPPPLQACSYSHHRYRSVFLLAHTAAGLNYYSTVSIDRGPASDHVDPK